MMPTPFVLNDAVAIKKTIKPSPIIIQEPAIVTEPKINTAKPLPIKRVPFVEPKAIATPSDSSAIQ
jgi:hypothetical protein